GSVSSHYTSFPVSIKCHHLHVRLGGGCARLALASISACCSLVWLGFCIAMRERIALYLNMSIQKIGSHRLRSSNRLTTRKTSKGALTSSIFHRMDLLHSSTPKIFRWEISFSGRGQWI